MARIPDDELARIKAEVSLLRLVEGQGYKPTKQGKVRAIACPFHEGDDTPSLIISPKSALFHCFSCPAAGSVIDWVMRTQGLSFRRKLLGTRLRKGTAQHFSPPGPHAGVWNVRASEEISLCEVLIDAMTFWVNGYRNVTASYGTGGFTDDHLAVFQAHGIKRVLIAYDRDEEGKGMKLTTASDSPLSGIDPESVPSSDEQRATDNRGTALLSRSSC